MSAQAARRQVSSCVRACTSGDKAQLLPQATPTGQHPPSSRPPAPTRPWSTPLAPPIIVDMPPSDSRWLTGPPTRFGSTPPPPSCRVADGGAVAPAWSVVRAQGGGRAAAARYPAAGTRCRLGTPQNRPSGAAPTPCLQRCATLTAHQSRAPPPPRRSSAGSGMAGSRRELPLHGALQLHRHRHSSGPGWLHRCTGCLPLLLTRHTRSPLAWSSTKSLSWQSGHSCSYFKRSPMLASIAPGGPPPPPLPDACAAERRCLRAVAAQPLALVLVCGVAKRAAEGQRGCTAAPPGLGVSNVWRERRLNVELASQLDTLVRSTGRMARRWAEAPGRRKRRCQVFQRPACVCGHAIAALHRSHTAHRSLASISSCRARPGSLRWGCTFTARFLCLLRALCASSTPTDRQRQLVASRRDCQGVGHLTAAAARRRRCCLQAAPLWQPPHTPTQLPAA